MYVTRRGTSDIHQINTGTIVQTRPFHSSSRRWTPRWDSGPNQQVIILPRRQLDLSTTDLVPSTG